MMRLHWCSMKTTGVILAAALVGCGDDETGTLPAGDSGQDTATDQGHLDVPSPSDAQNDDLSAPDVQDEDLSAPDAQEEDLGPQPTPVVGRIWNYTVSYPPLSFGYDYPTNEVTVGAYSASSTPLATTVTNQASCTPWDPGDPYMCGTFDLELLTGASVMLKASDNSGYIDTLTQIFTVEPGAVRIIVQVEEPIIITLSSVWQADLDDGLGHVAGIVATTSGQLHEAPYEEYIGDASVAISPSTDFGDDYQLVYYDSSNPTNTARTSTDASNPVFAAINLPARGFDDPYEITVTHATRTFEPVHFAIQPGVLTFLILSPEP